MTKAPIEIELVINPACLCLPRSCSTHFIQDRESCCKLGIEAQKMSLKPN
jgi:hypothetical protein